MRSYGPLKLDSLSKSRIHNLPPRDTHKIWTSVDQLGLHLDANFLGENPPKSTANWVLGRLFAKLQIQGDIPRDDDNYCLGEKAKFNEIYSQLQCKPDLAQITSGELLSVSCNSSSVSRLIARNATLAHLSAAQIHALIKAHRWDVAHGLVCYGVAKNAHKKTIKFGGSKGRTPAVKQSAIPGHQRRTLSEHGSLQNRGVQFETKWERPHPSFIKTMAPGKLGQNLNNFITRLGQALNIFQAK
jgi:hypothetical protein